MPRGKKNTSQNRKNNGETFRFPSESQLKSFYTNTLQNRIVPSEMMATLGYSATVALTAASPYFSYPLTPNAAYDVDPSLGSTATQGLTEFAALYSKMRVLGYSGTVEIINAGINPVEFTVVHSRSINGVTAGGGAVDLTLVDMNPYTQREFIGHAYANSKATFSFKHSVASIVGNEQVYVDDLYQSDVTSTPSRLIYLLIGGKTAVGNITAYARVRLNLHTRFTDRKLVTA
jgi:hypothetical protein